MPSIIRSLFLVTKPNCGISTNLQKTSQTSTRNRLIALSKQVHFRSNVFFLPKSYVILSIIIFRGNVKCMLWKEFRRQYYTLEAHLHHFHGTLKMEIYTPSIICTQENPSFGKFMLIYVLLFFLKKNAIK